MVCGSRGLALPTDSSGGNFSPFFKSLLLGSAAWILSGPQCGLTPSLQRGWHLRAVGFLSEVISSHPYPYSQFCQRLLAYLGELLQLTTGQWGNCLLPPTRTAPTMASRWA